MLVFVGCGEAPISCPATREVVFEGGAGLERVRRVVVGIDKSTLATIGTAGQARWIREIVTDAWSDGLIDGGEGVYPSVLREVVVIEADARTENGVL